MSAQHTPGPWWVTDHGVLYRGGYICHTQKPPYFEGQDERFAKECAEREANKVLIAAAPDLLDVAQEFERLCERVLAEQAIRMFPQEIDIWSERLERCREAIAKCAPNPTPSPKE